MSSEVRIEYADQRARKGAGTRLVKLPGATGHEQSSESPERIARRIRIDRAERRQREMERKLGGR